VRALWFSGCHFIEFEIDAPRTSRKSLNPNYREMARQLLITKVPVMKTGCRTLSVQPMKQQAPGQEWPPLSGSQIENHRLGQPAKGAVATIIGRLTRREANDNPDVGTPLHRSGVRAFASYEGILSPFHRLDHSGS